MQISSIIIFLLAFLSSSTSTPATTRFAALEAVQSAITQDLNKISMENVAPIPQTQSNVNPASVSEQPITTESVPANLPASSAPVVENPVLGSISIPGTPANDGSYPVTAILNSANHLFIELINQSANDDYKAQTASNNEVMRLTDTGAWTWTVTSYDNAGRELGTTTGSFTIGQ